MAQTATTSAYDMQAQQVLHQAVAHSLYNAQMQSQQGAAYERYEMGLYRPNTLGLTASQFNQLERFSRPAIISHQEEARRDEELYRRALAEHDDQEAQRLLRQIEMRERTQAEQQRILAEQQARNHQDQQQRQAAKDRARELLLEHLTPAQRDTLIRNGWFIVEGGRTRTKYRIHGNGGVAGNIDVLDRRDRITHRLCCHARDSNIPPSDHHLSQKIMLELAEDDFLRMANRHAA